MRKWIFVALLPVLQSCGQQPLIFSVMGDVPRSAEEAALLEKQIAAHNRFSPSEFMIHLGDIKSGSQPCDESVYVTVSAILRQLNVPTFIVPGDNEWNDCDDPARAWTYWKRYFLRFDRNWNHSFKVSSQQRRPENITFIRKQVLFIGINLVGGTIYDQLEWDSMLTDAADWTAFQFSAHRNHVSSAVVFAQANPKKKHEPFLSPFVAAAQSFGKPLLFIHGDGHKWELEKEWRAPNIVRVQVDKGGIAVPLEVTVAEDSKDFFSFNRNPFPIEGLTFSPQ